MSSRTLFRPALRGLPGATARPALLPRGFLSSRSRTPDRVTDNLNIEQLVRRREGYERDRKLFLVTGVVAGVVGIAYTSYKLKLAIDRKAEAGLGAESGASGAGKLDSNVPKDMFTVEGGTKRKVVVHDEKGQEVVPTGNSTVPNFPRTLELALPRSSAGGEENPIAATIQSREGTEYTLVGLGLRTVSFLSIQVYVVGFYVATSDVATLQNYLIKKVNRLATTLVPSEQVELHKLLMDPEEGEMTWDAILKESGCRSAFRIVPVRDTDFHHLRDGFMRAIAQRSQGNANFNDETFGQSIREFKQMFNRGKAPKGKELLLSRDADGQLTAMYDDGKSTGRQTIGTVNDERVSRLLWLNYLAGKRVASEPARQNIISGVMEFVERPIGTVATQVV